MIFTETTAYISVLLITITALWTIVAYPKNYLFKTIFIPVILFVGFSLFETYQSILGYATTADPPEKIQYIYHVKQDNFIFLLILFSCDNAVPFKKLAHQEDLTYYKNKKFTGVAYEKDNEDNIRVEKYYKDGKNNLTKLFDTKGRLQSVWTYNAQIINVVRYYKDGSVLFVQDYPA